MQEYYAKEYLQDLGYSGASGWGYHNDVLYKETLRLLEAGRKDKMLLVTKTLDMHQPYPYYGSQLGEYATGSTRSRAGDDSRHVLGRSDTEKLLRKLKPKV